MTPAGNRDGPVCCVFTLAGAMVLLVELYRIFLCNVVPGTLVVSYRHAFALSPTAAAVSRSVPFVCAVRRVIPSIG